LPDLGGGEVVEGHVSELGIGNRSLFDRPPRHPLAAAGLLTAAEAVNDDPERQAALARVLRASGQGHKASDTPWVGVFDRHGRSCSPGIREAFEPSARAYRMTSTSRHCWKDLFPDGLARWLGQHGTEAFSAALRDIADRLDTAARTVNYQRRRQALQQWCLDPGTWEEITSRLPSVPGLEHASRLAGHIDQGNVPESPSG
jgi:hypothetical protein